MAVLTLPLTAVICGFFALLPARLRGRAPARAELLAGLVPFSLLWGGAFLAFSKTGLFCGFGLFRGASLCGAAVWLGGSVCALRCYGRLGGAARLAALLAALLFAAAGAELFLCNSQFYATHEYTPIELAEYAAADSAIRPGAGGSLAIDADHATLSLAGIDQPLYNLQLDGLWFDYSGSTAAALQNPLLQITLSATDEASSSPYASYLWDVAWQAPRSWARTLDFSGAVQTLTLAFAPYEGEYIWYQGSYTLAGVRANVPRALDFSAARLAVLYLLFVAGWALRPGSGFWRTPFLAGRKSHRLAALACGGVLAVLAVAAPFADPLNSGVATAAYNVNNWDGGSRLSFTQHINESQHSSVAQYGALAHSLLSGRLDLMLDPPAPLTAMENPYDTAARQAAAPDALWDVGYYNGRYYVYFGIVPCLLFQLPFEALTGIQDLPPSLGMAVMALAMLLAVFAGLKAALRRWFPAASTAAYLLACTGTAAGSGLYYLLLRPAVYEYAILCGAAFTCLALWQWLLAANLADAAPAGGRGCARLRAHLALGSLCMALVAGCRPQMVLFAFLAVLLFWGRYLRGRRLFSRAGAAEALCFLLPVALVAAGLMAYNAARFGSPFDFGANYNLTSNDMTKRGFNAGRIGPALFAYFGLPPALQAVFPYLRDIALSTNLIGISISEKFYGGLFFMAPAALGILGAAPLRRRLRHGCGGFAAYAAAAALALAVVDCQMAGVLYRYRVDFAPLLLFAAMLCWFAAADALAARAALPGTDAAARLLRRDAARLQTAFRLAFAVSVAVGCALEFFTFFAAEPWLHSQNPALYQNVSRLLQFWL